MHRTYSLWIVGLVSTAAIAAQDDSGKTTASKPVQFTIESKSEIKTDRKITVDGEEFDGAGFGGGRGGFGGGGSGTTKTSIKLVFSEGTEDGSTWRDYQVAEASTTRPGSDGDQDYTVKSALSGKKVFVLSDDRGVVLREGSTKGSELPANLANGIPTRVSLSGLSPEGGLLVGKQFDVSKTFRDALKTVIHPIRPDAATGRGEGGGGARGRGQGGGQGDEGAQGRGGRQGRGAGGEGRGFGGPRGVEDAALGTLTNDKLDGKVSGKVVEIIQQDGLELAVVEIQGSLSGKGTPTALGLGGAFGGRGAGGRAGGGGGGRAGGGEDTGKASAQVAFTGRMLVDQASNSVRELKIEGTLKSDSESVRTMGRDGEEREIETKSNSEGTFSLQVAAKPAK
jgi:hypothetical protein